MSSARSAAALLALLALSADASDVSLVGLARDNTVLRFTAAHPEQVIAQRIEGVSGELLGIDRNPNDGALYGVSDGNDLYRIDVGRGAAELVSTLTLGFEGTARSGFDFNPQADRLRLVAASGQNLRVHVALGAVAVDGPLAYIAGDPNVGARPRVTAVAYTDNRARAATTRLFDIDAQLDVLALQEPPNDGGLRTVGSLGIDFAASGGFDILSGPDGAEHGYAVSGTTLYAIDLQSGRARELGAVGGAHGELIGLAAELPAAR